MTAGEWPAHPDTDPWGSPSVACVAVGEFPDGLCCADCHRPIPPGRPYTSRPEGMSGGVPVETLVCAPCPGRPTQVVA